MFSKPNFARIRYTLEHRRAFRRVEKRLLGHVSLRGYLHDIEKPFLMLFLDDGTVSRIHRHIARHHERAHTNRDYLEMVIDWECARYTKPDKPLNAYDTLYRLYPELEDRILPMLKELGIDGPTGTYRLFDDEMG